MTDQIRASRAEHLYGLSLTRPTYGIIVTYINV